MLVRIVHMKFKAEEIDAFLENPQNFTDSTEEIVEGYHVLAEDGLPTAQWLLEDTGSAVLVGASARHDLAVLRINVPFDRRPIGRSRSLSLSSSASTSFSQNRWVEAPMNIGPSRPSKTW